MGFIQEKLDWTFTTSNPIPAGGMIQIVLQAAIQFQVMNVGSYCILESVVYGIIAHQCTVSYIALTIQFTLSLCPGCPFPAGQFILHHWGIDNQITPGVKVGYQMKTVCPLGYIIDQSTIQSTFQYDNSATLLTIYLGNLQIAYKNKRARGFNQLRYIYRFMKLDFQVDRPIWSREKIVMNLGGFANDNILNQANLYCFILESNGLPSDQWEMVDIFGDRPQLPLSSLQLIPLNDIATSTTFTLQCNGVQIPFNFNPQPITAQLIL